MRKNMRYVFIVAVLTVLSACSEFKVEETDVVVKDDKLTNQQQFEQFVENVTKDKEDQVRVVTYTKEEKPLLHLLDYKYNTITLTVEKTEGKKKERLVSTSSCEAIRVDETTNKADYSLTECTDGKDVYLLTIQK
ncbi:DUF4362 domain-containing protein [Bacillus sp. CGMCC 1.16541]|uniref:DUF4362 domain-containing protein n=1 Tax=Bacillus sp. CGMCC 1.16541 TaxID=2185143 RepID=UPI000D739289|nr:DUF4362 domain-containing protein [Bacillus sp. CGMCC 1.16541]